MIDNIIRHTHEKIGHLAVDKTCDKISNHYWFPCMKPRVEHFIRNCLKCIVYSAPPRINNRNLHSIPKEGTPFDTLHIDHLGPLPSVRSQRKYILVVINAFTKYTKIYATRSTNAQEVCNILNQYMFYYSRPKRIITDRATCFTSNLFENFLENNGIKHVLNATCSPQANGQVERVNRILRPILSKLSNSPDHCDWSSHLRAAEYALNNTKHASTNFAPSILLFGVEQRGHDVDELTEFLDEKKYTDIARDLAENRNKASENIKRSQEINETYFRKIHKPAPEFEIGDFVVIRNVDTTVNQNKKLIPKFKGPYIVHKILPNDRYFIKDIEGCQITQIPYDGVLEANKLRKWIEPSEVIETNET